MSFLDRVDIPMDQDLRSVARRLRAFPRSAVRARLPSRRALIPSLRKEEEGSLQVGLLVALGLIVSATGAVWLLQGGKQAALSGSEANSAQAIAEAGADLIIGVWNEPENRRLLVAGDAAPSTWTATNQTSPCLSSTNTRPGANNGNPSAEARNLVDGNFRNIDNISQTATGDRRFRLKAVRYSTGAPGSSDRRTISRTFNTTSSTPTTTAGTFTGNFRNLINLDDPDGSGTIKPGINTGLIAVEVESQVYRNGVLVGTATVTKEYQVMPKCCGGSLGSNNTGGSGFSGSGSLGSDSRFCGVDFGMIVGINGGKFWSYFANDIYRTIDPSTGSEVNISTILGLVSNPSYRFERNAASADSNNGCRVIPGPCSTTSDLYVTGATTSNNLNDSSLFSNINSSSTGTASDRAGTSASGIPIVPLFINNGLPSVSTRFAYSWTSGGRPAVNFASGGTFGPTFTSTAATTTFRLRTRNDTTPPRVEFCDGTYPTVSATSTNCTANSWAQISLPSGTATATLTIGDDFASAAGYSGTTIGSVNRWPTIWIETDPSGAAQSTTAGNVTINGSGPNAFLRLSGTSNTTNTSARRVVNLHALQSPHLRFNYRKLSSLSGTRNLVVEYSTDNGASYVTPPLATIPRTTNDNEVFTLALPPGAQTGYTTIRFRLASSFSSTEWVGIDNVQITNNSGGAVSIDNWCEYSNTSPSTAQFIGGFHCLGPLLQMANGGRFIVDTSGGNLNFYYNSTFDTRGTSLASPLINMAAGAELLHVNCPISSPLINPPNPTGTAVTPTNNCLTGIPPTVYAAVGENDLLNIFGRDTPPNNNTSSPTMQWVRIGSTSTSPGKITGAFFYMPYGSVYLIADGCDGGGTVPTTYNFNGRVWSRNLIACGRNYFLTPPSSTLNLAALGITSNISLNTTGFVGSTGTDWAATTATGTRVNGSL
jgi:hypothetical protein